MPVNTFVPCRNRRFRPQRDRGLLAAGDQRVLGTLALGCAAMTILLATAMARAEAPAAAAPAAAPPAPSDTATLIAPTATEAAQWRRLRTIQALVPPDNHRELPFASMKIGSGSGAIISQKNHIGGSFRLQDVTYYIDGRELSREDREDVLKGRKFPVFEGRMLPGKHDLRVEVSVRGHGYGIFSYMQAYRVRLQAEKTFEIYANHTTRLQIMLDEHSSAPLQQRFSLRFDVEHEASRAKATGPGPAGLSSPDGIAPLPL